MLPSIDRPLRAIHRWRSLLLLSTILAASGAPLAAQTEFRVGIATGLEPIGSGESNVPVGHFVSMFGELSRAKGNSLRLTFSDVHRPYRTGLPSDIVDLYGIDLTATVPITHTRWQPYWLVSTGPVIGHRKEIDVGNDISHTGLTWSAGVGLGVRGRLGGKVVGIEARVLEYKSSVASNNRAALPIGFFVTF